METPELHQGDSGEWVTYLQGLLEQAGFPPGSADGHFGHRTEQAVKEAQWAHGLSPTGVVDVDTWARLGATAAPSWAEEGTVDPNEATYVDIVFKEHPQFIDDYVRWVGVNRGNRFAPSSVAFDLCTMDDMSTVVTAGQDLPPGATYEARLDLTPYYQEGEHEITIRLAYAMGSVDTVGENLWQG